jgi:hypothetical protein
MALRHPFLHDLSKLSMAKLSSDDSHTILPGELLGSWRDRGTVTVGSLFTNPKACIYGGIKCTAIMSVAFNGNCLMRTSGSIHLP